VALREVRDNPGLLWSFLLMSGYLKVVSHRQEGRTVLATLAIPNKEVLSIYETMFRTWLDKSLGSDRRREELLRALLRGDAETCQRHLQHWLVQSASSWDTAAYDPPERFYHGFVLGVLVGLGSRYEVLSNRESGLGRCDVMIAPTTAGQPGVVLEFKVREKDETVEQALLRAEQQIRERRYAQGLRGRGAEPVHEMAFVFDGREIHGRRLAG
jgi:hypothetical protein